MTPLRVGSEAYYALPPKQRFDVAVAALVDYSARTDRKWDTVQKLEQEVFALRVDCSLGPPDRPDLADPLWDITHNTYFRSTGLGGALTLFNPSPAQADDLLAVFESDRRLGIPGRYFGAKTRRVGGSHTIGQWIRTRVSRREGQPALVTAHDAPSAETIFREIYKIPWQNDPLRPPADYSNKRQILLTGLDSSITVMTVARGESKGAGTGYMYIHWSEILRYEELGVDVEDLVTNQLSTMPQGVETFAFGESSGRGDGGVAYDWFQEAYKDPTNADLSAAPEGGWRMIFLPSYKRWDASLKIEGESERSELLDSLEPDEAHLVHTLKQPLEHVKWRRWYEATQIKARSAKQRKALMRQECPITFTDCFQSKGSTEFDGDVIRTILLTRDDLEPSLVGDLVADGELYDAKRFRQVAKTPMPSFKERSDGDIMVWDEPIGEKQEMLDGTIPHRYCMGVDISEGGDSGNFSYIHLVDRDTKDLVAAYHGRAQHADLLRIVRYMSRWYNDALICNEVNRFRQWTEDLASTDRQRFMYIRRGVRDSIDQDRQDAFGWLTTMYSKDALVESLHGVLENVPQFLRWKVLLEEMKTFRRERVTERRGKGVKSLKDDTVMGAGMAWYCDRDMPKTGRDPLAPIIDAAKSPLEKQWTEWKAQQKKAARGAQRRRHDIRRRQFP